MNRLQGKTVLITGGTTGIGFVTAKLLQQEGAAVAISGQNPQRLDQASAELGDVLAVRADSRSLEEISQMVGQVESRFGSLDVLFANAGVTMPMPIMGVDEAHINEQMNINFKGVFFTIQKALPIMRDGGSIVLTTSCLNQMGMPGMSVYAASKAAVRSLARSLSAELGDRNIRVNAISPGPIETPIYSKLGMPAADLEQMASQLTKQIPMHRFGQPEEIAKAVLFLASDESSFVLGEEIVVDGGWSAL
ncbi:MAG: SDR family oxidoreductase [Cyanobacteria bacterium P01_G01_bin.38]